MKKLEVNGKEIKTNYGGNYGFANGNWECSFHNAKFGESERQMLERLTEEGYSKITFYWSRTAVRGYYELTAVCKY